MSQKNINPQRRLLVVTQAVDLNDPILGFFYQWIAELKERCDEVSVICLRSSMRDLPDDIAIVTIGVKYLHLPKFVSRMLIMARFLKAVWIMRHKYDAVLVHMNQEYVLIAGWFWRLCGKRIYMWRNHWGGSLLTDCASMMCHKIFCTSKYSYTAKFDNATLMPVGVDKIFSDTRIANSSTVRDVSGRNSILFLGRIAPSKNPDILLEGIAILKANGIKVAVDFYGPAEYAYLANLKHKASELGIDDIVCFHAGVAHRATPAIFAKHDIFVNLSKSGMYDKTLFESASSGCFVLCNSRDFAQLAGEEFFMHANAQSVADAIAKVLSMNNAEFASAKTRLQLIANTHSLNALINALIAEIFV